MRRIFPAWRSCPPVPNRRRSPDFATASLPQACNLVYITLSLQSTRKSLLTEPGDGMSESQKNSNLELTFLPDWAREEPDQYSYSSPDRKERKRDDTKTRNPRASSKQKKISQGRDAGQRNETKPRSGARPEPRKGRRNRSSAPRLTKDEFIASHPGLSLSFAPDSEGVASLAKQIRLRGRAYSLFEIAGMVLKRPDRFDIVTSLRPDGKGQRVKRQWLCLLDQSLWVSSREAVDHVLKHYFDRFYERKKVPVPPPKGNFSFVAQCGMSNVLLGPPNHHDYPETLRKHHATRFPDVNFETFKKRIKIVRDEETLKEWIESQSWKSQFAVRAEPGTEGIVLETWDALVAHFEKQHLKNTLISKDRLSFKAESGINNPCRKVQNLIRFHLEEQLRYPLEMAVALRPLFARHGLHCFKAADGKTFVSIARPQTYDVNLSEISDRCKRILDFIEQTPNCSRKVIIENLEPGEQEPAGDSAPDQSPPPSAPEAKTASTEASQATKDTLPIQLTTAQVAVINDLNWLIFGGYIIEFSNGGIVTSRQLRAQRRAPGEKPQKPPASPPQTEDPQGKERIPENPEDHSTPAS